MDNKIDLLLSFYKPSNETESQLLEAVRVELKNILEENISLTEHIKNARKERDRWKARAKKRDEILEILKGIIKNNVFDVGMLDDRPNGETWLSCEDYGITLKTEDYKKIVGWKNEK